MIKIGEIIFPEHNSNLYLYITYPFSVNDFVLLHVMSDSKEIIIIFPKFLFINMS